jgi:hypothetical protein
LARMTLRCSYHEPLVYWRRSVQRRAERGASARNPLGRARP